MEEKDQKCVETSLESTKSLVKEMLIETELGTGTGTGTEAILPMDSESNSALPTPSSTDDAPVNVADAGGGEEEDDNAGAEEEIPIMAKSEWLDMKKKLEVEVQTHEHELSVLKGVRQTYTLQLSELIILKKDAKGASRIWIADFEKEHSREPLQSEVQANPKASALFDKYAHIKNEHDTLHKKKRDAEMAERNEIAMLETKTQALVQLKEHLLLP